MKTTMKMVPSFTRLLLAAIQLPLLIQHAAAADDRRCGDVIAPRVMILSMFEPEATPWHERLPNYGLGNLSAVAVAAPGLSMLFPLVRCTADGRVCQATLGEGEINAAASAMALVLSPALNLSRSYFLAAGVAGVNPRHSTLGGVALARFAVQAALQSEIDPRSLPANWSTGYIPFGRSRPLDYPRDLYGTEVFELNADLRRAAAGLAARAGLADDEPSRRYRARYAADPRGRFGAGARPPAVAECDCTTSDVYFSGTLLAEAFERTTEVWTNGTGSYCMTAQEDNAVLEVLLRAAIEDLVDFSRVIVMRTGSNFDRPPPGTSDWAHLTSVDDNGFDIAVENLFRAGVEIVKGIVGGWDAGYARGVVATNYLGDVFGSLGGKPGFGPGSIFGGRRVPRAGGRGAKLARRGAP